MTTNAFFGKIIRTTGSMLPVFLWGKEATGFINKDKWPVLILIITPDGST